MRTSHGTAKILQRERARRTIIPSRFSRRGDWPPPGTEISQRCSPSILAKSLRYLSASWHRLLRPQTTESLVLAKPRHLPLRIMSRRQLNRLAALFHASNRSPQHPKQLTIPDEIKNLWRSPRSPPASNPSNLRQPSGVSSIASVRHRSAACSTSRAGISPIFTVRHPRNGFRPARCTSEIGFRVRRQTSIARISFCSSVGAIFSAASRSIRRKTRCRCAAPCFCNCARNRSLSASDRSGKSANPSSSARIYKPVPTVRIGRRRALRALPPELPTPNPDNLQRSPPPRGPARRLNDERFLAVLPGRFGRSNAHATIQLRRIAGDNFGFKFLRQRHRQRGFSRCRGPHHVQPEAASQTHAVFIERK